MYIKAKICTIVFVTLTLSTLIISSLASPKKDRNKFFVKSQPPKKDEDKALKSGSMDFSASKKSEPTKKPLVGGSKYYDDLLGELYLLGDSYGGLPEHIHAITHYCHKYSSTGLKLWGYISVRWSKKYLLKSVVSLVAIGFIKTNGVYCKTILSMNDYVNKAKLVNQNNDDLVKIRKQFQSRLNNIADKIENLNEKSQHACCAYYDYKNKTIDATRAEARTFLDTMLNGFFSAAENILCQSMLGQTSVFDEPTTDCEGVKFNFVDSEQPIGRNWLLPFTNLLAQFV